MTPIWPYWGKSSGPRRRCPALMCGCLSRGKVLPPYNVVYHLKEKHLSHMPMPPAQFYGDQMALHLHRWRVSWARASCSTAAFNLSRFRDGQMFDDAFTPVGVGEPALDGQPVFKTVLGQPKGAGLWLGWFFRSFVNFYQTTNQALVAGTRATV